VVEGGRSGARERRLGARRARAVRDIVEQEPVSHDATDKAGLSLILDPRSFGRFRRMTNSGQHQSIWSGRATSAARF